MVNPKTGPGPKADLDTLEESLDTMVRNVDIADQGKSEILKNPVPYEDTKEAVNISIDEVGAKQQTENREKKTQGPPAEHKRK
jgi:hypothetical protein